MGKTLYLECYSGISGDMTVAALLDLGADRSVLDRVLKSLKVSGFETKIRYNLTSIEISLHDIARAALRSVVGIDAKRKLKCPAILIKGTTA